MTASRTGILAAALALAVAGPSGCRGRDERRAPPARREYLTVREVPLGYVDEHTPVRTFEVGPRDRHVTMRLQRGEKQVMVIDGKEGPAFDQVLRAVFSDDGRCVAYRARRGEKWLMVVDGHTGPPYDALWDPWFDADGAQTAYVGWRGEGRMTATEKWLRGVPSPLFTIEARHLRVDFACEPEAQFMVVNGKEFGPYDDVGRPSFGPEGKRFAFWAARDDKEFIVLNGKPLRPHDRVGGLTFSPDGTRTAFRAGRRLPGSDASPLADARWCVIVDGTAGKEYAQVGEPVFSPDSRHVAYKAFAQEPADSDLFSQSPAPTPGFVVRDGIEGTGCFHVGDMFWWIRSSRGPLFSPDSERLAYVAADGDKEFVVVDGEKGAPYSDVGRLTFSPDSSRFGYVGQTGGADGFGDLFGGGSTPVTQSVVVGGIAGPEFRQILEGPVFSPDSRHVVYRALVSQKEQTQVLMLDGKPFGPTCPLWHDWSGPVDLPVLSPDWRHWALPQRGEDGADRVIRDGVPGKPYDDTCGLTFSPDSRHLAWWARRGKVWRIVVDDVETGGEGYDGYIRGSRIVFDGPKRLHALAYRKPHIIRLDVRIDR